MAEIDVLKAQLVRNGVHEPWGFKLMGGADQRSPLIIQSILQGGPAARIGLRPGDEISEVGDAVTKHMTLERANKVISQYGTTMILTVERSAYGSAPAQPQMMNPAPGGGYERPMNPSYQQPRDFQRAQARPFEAPPRPHPAPPPPQPQPQQEYRPQPQQEYHPQYQHMEPENKPGYISQSGTFNVLASLMSNEEPAAGSGGLPPQRSAYQERRRAEGQPYAAASPRVKVFMPQQYNTPLGMYSAQNVVETFQGQAERQLETLESHQPDVYSGAQRACLEEDRSYHPGQRPHPGQAAHGHPAHDASDF